MQLIQPQGLNDALWILVRIRVWPKHFELFELFVKHVSVWDWNGLQTVNWHWNLWQSCL